MKFIKITSNSTQKKTQKEKKTSFPNKSVENEEFFKHALNKIMTTHE